MSISAHSRADLAQNEPPTYQSVAWGKSPWLPVPQSGEAGEALDSAEKSENWLAAWSIAQLYGPNAFQTGIVPMQTLPERLAEILLEMSGHQSEWIEGFRVATLAEQLGIYCETAGALLRSFTRQGFVELGYYRMRVVDVQSLQELCDMASR